MKGDTFLAFLAGAAVGVAFGLAFAPERGEVTRRRMKDAARGGCDAVQDALDSLEEALAETRGESGDGRDAEGEEGRNIEIA